MKKPLSHIFLSLLFLASACESYEMKKSNPIQPVVVIPTCTTCRMFLSDVTPDAAFGGAAGADAICAQSSNKPSSGTYKALLMDNTRNQNLNWVLKANTDYYRSSDDALIGRTNGDRIFSLFGGNFLTNSTDINFEYIYTGIMVDSNSSWSLSSDNCSNWTDGSASGRGISADTNSTDAVAITSGVDFCHYNFYRVLCVEQ